MRRFIAMLTLATGCTGGGEGGANVEGTVELRSITCELPDPMTIVTRATIDVFMRDNLQLRAFASSNAFPQDVGIVSTSIFSCGGWMATSVGCTRRVGDPARATVSFTNTANLDSQLPADVSVSVSALVTNDLGDNFAEDFDEAACP